ncbi:MAG: Sulfur carrier protein ThiS adenylyltransferase [Verrucomicrobiota bacterium]|jgi:adenylyltransferase/sulfurtransferase
MFELTAAAIDSAALKMRLAAPEVGALTIFEGRVRNHHLGQAVTLLEYEAFDDLARIEGEAITAETERIYPGTKVLCVHRTGTLAIGEAAVWIGIASAHREAGFAACRHVIEEIKLRLPVWKKEHHPGGAAEWVNCTAETASLPAQDELSARQAALPEVGAAGQAKLAAARVLIVGVGGLGCPAAVYLAGAGIGHLTLVDGGKVERSNLQRQILFTTAEIGAPKALAAAARLRLHNPAGRMTSYEGELTPSNARSLIAGQSVVLDCTDNFATRFLLHDTCLALGVPLVSAAVHRFEGSLEVFRHGDGGCLHCQWLGKSATTLDTAGSCAGGPVFGPAVGVLGVMQAAETIKLLLSLEGDSPRQSRLINLLDGSQCTIAREARPNCPVCSDLFQLKKANSVTTSDSLVFLDSSGVAALGPTAQTIYLTEPGETSPPGKITVAALDLSLLREFASAGPLVLTCRHGVRSAALARILRAEARTCVFALAQG